MTTQIPTGVQRGVAYAFAALTVACMAYFFGGGERPVDASASNAEIVRELYATYDAMAREDFPDIPTADARDVLRDLQAGEDILFVDIREPEEREVSSLPGAVTADEVLCCPEKWRGRRVVAYCTVSYRSGLWVRDNREALAEAGVRLQNLRGGLLAWVHAGGKVYDAKGPTRRVHVYSKSWDYSPREYEAVY